MKTAATDELLTEIASAVANDERYADRSWTGIALVAIIGEGVRQLSGYLFDASGDAEAGRPRNRDIAA